MKNLNLIERNNYKGHAARRDRKKGLIPGVLYGNERANFLFEVGEIELESVLSKIGDHGTLNVCVDGKEEKVLIKSLQKDSVTHKPMHIDLQEIEASSEIMCDVPIIFKNEGYLNSFGAILQKQKNSVKVRCDSECIPNCIELDFKNYAVGDIVRVEDLKVENNSKILDDADDVIVSINYSNKSKFDEEETQ